MTWTQPEEWGEPDVFGKDEHLLIAALDRLAAYAKEEELTLEDVAREGIEDPDYPEICALIVLRSAFFGGPERTSRKVEAPGREGT